MMRYHFSDVHNGGDNEVNENICGLVYNVLKPGCSNFCCSKELLNNWYVILAELKKESMPSNEDSKILRMIWEFEE